MYARERVRPKLYDLDSEKLARLFADLRRESAATGSFPITVRHLESMIRMAEASARMALREYVRADDIDLAISVAIDSFVNAQKMSIKKTLQRVRNPFFRPQWLIIVALTFFLRLFFRASASTSHSRAITKSSSPSSLARSSKKRRASSSCSATANPS